MVTTKSGKTTKGADSFPKQDSDQGSLNSNQVSVGNSSITNLSNITVGTMSRFDRDLEHILTEVMALPAENAIRLALEYEQITSVDDLLDLDYHGIETLQYEENGSIKSIRKHQKGRLQSFRRYAKFLTSLVSNISDFFMLMAHCMVSVTN